MSINAGKRSGSWAKILGWLRQCKNKTPENPSCLSFSNELITLCPDAVIGLDRKGAITVFNRAAERLTGYSATEILGSHIDLIYGEREKSRAIKRLIYDSDHGGRNRIQGIEVEMLTRKGNRVSVRLSATLLFDGDREVGSIGFFHDITERKQLEHRLRELSITDSLCGLYNHRHFYSVLQDELTRSQRYGRNLSLICIDLDKFKQLNDSIGHIEGDNILRYIADTLQQITRESDNAFRYGGDEFMIVLPETSHDEAYVTAEKIRNRFSSEWPFNPACDMHGLEQVTLSLGIAQAEANDDLESLIGRADQAMYNAKRAGGNRTSKSPPIECPVE